MNNPRKNKDGVIVTGRTVAARNIRKDSGVMNNSDGSVSTHKMEWGTSDSKKRPYVVNPTIFPNKTGGGYTDMGGKGNEAYKEATSRGEVFGFKSAKRAEKFSYGVQWKQGEDKKEAKQNYKTDKKAGNLAYKEVRKEVKSKKR